MVDPSGRGASAALAVRTREPAPAPGPGKDIPIQQRLAPLIDRLTPDQKERMGAAIEALERGSEISNPYEGINRILGERPRVIDFSEIAAIYLGHAIRNGKTDQEIQEGANLLFKAYLFAERAFSELGAKDPRSQFRKDGQTPLFAHSTRLAAMMAYLGFEADVIAGMLLHDVVEDCKVNLREIGQQFGKHIRNYVALWTKPKLQETNGQGPIRRGWAYLVDYINEPERWARMEDMFTEGRYRERMEHQFEEILNTRSRNVTPKKKIRVYFGKIMDAIDSLVSDQHLDPARAEIRLTGLVAQMPVVDTLSPEIGAILRKLLAPRGWGIPITTGSAYSQQLTLPGMPLDLESAGNAPEISGPAVALSAVVEVPPLSPRHFSVMYLRRFPKPCPPPHGRIIVYPNDDRIRRDLRQGKFNGRIRVELPHYAPSNAIDKMIRYVHEENGLSHLQFRPGKSALPSVVDGAGRITWVTGIRNQKMYDAFKARLAQFHTVLHEWMDGTGRAP